MKNSALLAKGKEGLSAYSSLFKGPFYSTFNQDTIIPCNVGSPQLFDSFQKPFDHVLIRQTDDPANPLEFYFVDLNDVAQMEAKLAEECAKPEKMQSKAWLHQCSSKDYTLKTTAATPEDWQDNPAFLDAIVKLYVFAGFNYLTHKEEMALARLVEKVGKEEFSKLIQLIRGSDINEKELLIYRRLLLPIPLKMHSTALEGLRVIDLSNKSTPKGTHKVPDQVLSLEFSEDITKASELPISQPSPLKAPEPSIKPPIEATKTKGEAAKTKGVKLKWTKRFAAAFRKLGQRIRLFFVKFFQAIRNLFKRRRK